MSKNHRPASGFSRRRFLSGLGSAAAVTAISTTTSVSTGLGHAAVEEAVERSGAPRSTNPVLARRDQASKIRIDRATANSQLPLPDHLTNGDESRYPSRIGSYTKGLPHNRFGEVDSYAWSTLKAALDSGSPTAFENILLGGGRPLLNPQSGLAFDLEGADSHALAVPAPPSISSAEAAGEMVELYWMALLRDTNLDDYDNSPLAAAAASDLNKLSNFKGPRDANGKVTTRTLFRDPFPGQTVGPYISQFMLLPTPLGAQFVESHNRTFLSDTDHMTNYNDWLTVQNGGLVGSSSFDSMRRYIRNGRDIAAWVQNDMIYQAYLNASLILLTPPNSHDLESGGIGAPLNPGNPYRHSRTQVGSGTFGPQAIFSLMPEVASRALKASGYQKWLVHRRLPPEAYGGLVHVHRTRNRYPDVLYSAILDAPVLDRVFSKNGSYLLPQAFPEGATTHPSFTSDHGTVAGACVTILKAMFDESHVIPNPIQVTPDGLGVVPYNGPDLTVGGELNKLASNIATGRNIAGVNWRSDSVQSMLLGEALAISILRDQSVTYNENRENFLKGLTFTRFDGTEVTV
jgi:hypothetical protein